MRIAILFGILLLATGCYYGAMQGAHTLGENHMIFRGNLMLPAFFSAEGREEAEEAGDDNLNAYPTFTFSTGATERIDVGLSAYGYGVGPLVKIGLLDPSGDKAVSVLLNASYVIPARVIGSRASLAAGLRFGSNLEAWAGYEVGYSPDFLNIPEKENGGHDWGEVENTVFQCLRIGCQFEIGSPGSYVPESIVFEFLVPLDLRWNMIVAGLGITY